jgi:hypothetical protein
MYRARQAIDEADGGFAGGFDGIAIEPERDDAAFAPKCAIETAWGQ